MKITKSELRKLIREAIREEMLATEDFYPGKYSAPSDIVERYSNIVMKQLNVVEDHKARIGIVNAFTSAVDDAIEFASPTADKAPAAPAPTVQ
jgi:hypothetical protein